MDDFDYATALRFEADQMDKGHETRVLNSSGLRGVAARIEQAPAYVGEERRRWALERAMGCASGCADDIEKQAIRFNNFAVCGKFDEGDAA
jgi:hypothetical protein